MAAASTNARFKITVANQKFGGILAGVRFENGIGLTDNASQAHTIAQYGASVEDRDPPEEEHAATTQHA
jgi:hypothetical protein